MSDFASTSSSRSSSLESPEDEDEDDQVSFLPLSLDLPSLSTSAFPASKPTELFEFDLELSLLVNKFPSAVVHHVDLNDVETSTTRKAVPRPVRSPVIKNHSTRSKRPQIVTTTATSSCSVKPSICSPTIEEEQAGPDIRMTANHICVNRVPVERMDDRDGRANDMDGREDDTSGRADSLDGRGDGMDGRADGRDRRGNEGYGRATEDYPRANEGYIERHREEGQRHDRPHSDRTHQPNQKPVKGQGRKGFLRRAFAGLCFPTAESFSSTTHE